MSIVGHGHGQTTAARVVDKRAISTDFLVSDVIEKDSCIAA